MQQLQRPVLILILLVGLGMAFWPVGEKVYGWWCQRALEVSWQRAAKAAARQQKQPSAEAHSAPSSPAMAALPDKWLPTRIVIPEIKLDAVVVRGVDSAALRRGPGHDAASALPGHPGTCIIAGHRNMYGWWFYKLTWLSPGATIELRTPLHTYHYQMDYMATVNEYDSSILKAPVGIDDAPRLILYTCTLPKSTNRDLVVARLVSIKRAS